MTLTSADMLFWTGIELSQEDVSRYESSCLLQIRSDFGDNVPSVLAEEATCYLIAVKVENKTDTGQITSEHLGNYSYSKSAVSSWYDKYQQLLSSYKSSVSGWSVNRGTSSRVDTDMVQMNWRY